MRIVLLIALGTGSIAAAPIVDLFNTGQSGPDGVDQNWTLNGGPAFVTDGSRYPFPLWTKNPAASWISPRSNYDGVSDAADTTFIFSTTFNLPAHFEVASILMQVATDNGLQDIQLNGISLGYTPAMMLLFGNSTPTRVIADGTGFTSGLGPKMTIATGFQPGPNTLKFYVRNSATTADNMGNPSGLIVAFTSDVIESPEPASLGLFAGGLALIGLLSARQRKTRC
jgi:hypothetical protein